MLKQYLANLMRLVALLCIFIFLTVVSREFLSMNNLINVLRQSALLFILGSGITLTILTAGIDLSIGSVLALSACVMGTVLKLEGVFLGILTGLAIGGACGFLNGAMVAFLGLPPFIATYGMLWIAQGLALMFMKAEIIYGFPPVFRFLGAGGIAGIPTPVILMFLVFGGFYLLLNYTVVGRSVYSVGANMSASIISGIPVKRTLLIVYTLSGLFAAFAGMVYISRINAVEAGIGESLLLPPIAAICIGGTSLFGGEGGIGGTLLGAIIMSLVINGMNLLGVTSFWQSFAVGSIVIFSVAIDQIRTAKFQTN